MEELSMLKEMRIRMYGILRDSHFGHPTAEYPDRLPRETVDRFHDSLNDVARDIHVLERSS